MSIYKNLSSAVVAILVSALSLIGCDEKAVKTEASSGLTPDSTASALRAHLNFLADDLLQGRLPGTDGYDIAAKYVASQFEQMGLKPAGDNGSYFQNVPLRVTRPDHVGGKMTLNIDGEARELVSLKDFVIGGEVNTSESTVTAPVVFAGYGVEAPAFGIDSYDGLDVQGKIVLVLVGAPNNLPGEERAYFGNLATKSVVAARHGAVGLVIVHSLTYERIFPFERVAARSHLSQMMWQEADGKAHDPAPELRASGLLSADTARAMFTGAEKSFDDALAEAEEEGGNPAGFPLNVQLTISQKSRHADIISPNVAGVIEGTDPRLKAEYIVLTAHLDHDGVSTPVNGDEIYNGALDNASGTAAIMEVARALAANPPRRSVIFVAVTAEEKGLLGAEYYARFPTVPKSSIVANINVDGVLAFFDFAEVIVFGHGHSSLGGIVARIAAQMELGVGEDPFPEQGFFVRSDHYRFVQQGIPSIFPWVGMKATDQGINGAGFFSGYLGQHYHRPSDDMNLPWDWTAFAKFTRFVTAVTRDVANAEERPTWNEGDFFGDLFAGP